MHEVILSIDCGTQSLRAILFSSEGRLLHMVKIDYKPYFSSRPGWAEQDADAYWKSLCEACYRLGEEAPDLVKRVVAVGLCTQRNSMVNVDEEGRPLRPIITWLDQRKAKPVYTPSLYMRLVYRSTGMNEAVARAQTDGKCNWIRQYQPEVWHKTYKYLQLSGFLNYRLTGEFSDSIASQIGHIPMNYKKMKWSSRRQLTARLFPIERSKLPLLVKPGDPIGKITAQAAQETGIAEGTPVIACGSDKGCETLGMGVLNEGMVSLSFGTTATVQTTTRRYFEPIRFMPPYPAVIPRHYNPEVEIFRGYWMITWFKEEFAYELLQEAAERRLQPEVVLNSLLAEAPPGCMGLMVQPFWGPGLTHPTAKGSIIGFGDVHRKPHVYRAVIEGLGYALLDGFHRIQKAGRCRPERVAVSGGASESDEICQITTDIFNLPLVRGHTSETSGLGAAIAAAVGAGVHPSFQTAIEHMVTYEKVFEPDPRNAALYHELYTRVYAKIYDALMPLYKEIREITGYPEKQEL